MTVTSPQLVHVNSCDLLPQFLLVSEISIEEEESSEPQSSVDKTSDIWCKTDKNNQAMSFSLEPRVRVYW